MSSEINLLYSRKQRQKYKLSSQVRVLRLAALAFLFLSVITSVSFFLLVVSSPLSSLKQDELQQNQLLSQSESKVRKQTLLALRMGDITTIVNKRSQFNGILSILIKNLPPGVIIKDFTAEKKQVTLGILATSSQDIDTYTKSLEEMVKNRKYFSRVFLDSMYIEVTNDRQATGFRARYVIQLL